jgi:hypothetical protein
MAAKKAAKKSTKKTRTSTKKSNNKSIMRWWYVLPVIAIVAVAGYAVVRFSEAGTAVKRVGSGLQGGTSNVDKSGTRGTARVIGNVPVSASWSQTQRGTSTRFCAEVFLSGGNRSASGNGGVTIQLRQGSSNIGNPITTFGRGYKTVCTNSLGNFDKLRIAGKAANLVVSRQSGFASVVKMYVKQ